MVESILTAVLEALLVVFVIVFSRGPGKRDPISGAIIMQYSGFVRRAALFLTVAGPMLVPVLLLVFPPKEEEQRALIGIGLIVCGWVLFGAFVCRIVIKRRLVLTEDEVIVESPWRRPSSFRWAEIKAVSYSDAHNALVIVGPDGRRVSIPPLLTGRRELVRLIRAQLPPERYNAAAGGFVCFESGDFA